MVCDQCELSTVNALRELGDSKMIDKASFSNWAWFYSLGNEVTEA